MKIDSSIKLSPLILLVLSLCFSSCSTTRTVERRVIVHDTLKVNRTDTLRFTALVRDSVYLHDSVYLEGATTVSSTRRAPRDGTTERKPRTIVAAWYLVGAVAPRHSRGGSRSIRQKISSVRYAVTLIDSIIDLSR